MKLDPDILIVQNEAALVVTKAAELFQVPLSDAQIEERVSGELFSRYAKNPAMAYDPADRVKRRDETKERLKAEMAEARDWAKDKAAASGLSDALAKPLVGENTPLL